MHSINDAFSTDPYFFAPLENAAYGPSTVPPQLFSDPPPIDTFDLSWIKTNYQLLDDTPFANPFLPLHPFETSWFADSEASSFPPLNDFQYRGSFRNRPAVCPSAPNLETNVPAVTNTTPTRRVQKGKRKDEQTRIKFLQSDKHIVSFTEARVTCAGCYRSIKLDTRNGARYYPGFWVRHRGKCKGVAK